MRNIKFALIMAVFVFSQQAEAQNSCDLGEAKNRFDSLPYEQQQTLKRSCRETYTPGVGWTNSALGCGRCPVTSPNYYSYMDPINAAKMQKIDGVVAAGASAQQALVSFASNWAAKKHDEANERILNIRMEVSERFNSEEKEKYVQRVLVEPEIEVIKGVYKTEVVLSLKTGYFADCVVPHFDYSVDAMGGWTYSVKKDDPICKEEAKKNIWLPTYYNGISENNYPPYSMPYKLKETKKGLTICQTAMGMSAGCAKDRKKEEFTFSDGFVSDVRKPNKTLVYAGGTSETLWLTLIEGNTSKNVKFDLSKKKTIECGGAIVDVIEADGESLTYKVVKELDGETNSSSSCGDLVTGEFRVEKQSAGEVEEKMRALKRLLDDGLISGEEYNNKKQEIINSL